jgi:hypothetical protein
MEILDILKKVEESSTFKKWKKEKPKAYLAHFFFIAEGNTMGCEVGYYNPENHLIATFIVEDKVLFNKEDKVFKEQEKLVEKLDLDKVKVDVLEAKDSARALQKTKYASEVPIKLIMILQNLEMGQLWNITFVTRSFKTLNIKLDAVSGDVLSDKLVSIMQFPGK